MRIFFPAYNLLIFDLMTPSRSPVSQIQIQQMNEQYHMNCINTTGGVTLIPTLARTSANTENKIKSV